MTNVKLQIENGPVIFGELSISDFLLGEHSKTLSQADIAGGKQPLRVGRGDLVFDHWVHWLNNVLRETVHLY